MSVPVIVPVVAAFFLWRTHRAIAWFLLIVSGLLIIKFIRDYKASNAVVLPEFP